jgi:hypothetical protein
MMTTTVPGILFSHALTARHFAREPHRDKHGTVIADLKE